MPSLKAARLLCQLPREARVFRAIDPASEWSWNEIYLAQCVDALNILLWRDTKDAKSGRNKPKSVMPDFIQKAARRSEREKTGQEAMDIDMVKSLLSRNRQ